MNKKLIIIVFIILSAVFLVKQNTGKENLIIEQEELKIDSVTSTEQIENIKQEEPTIEGLKKELLELEQMLKQLEQKKKEYEK